MEINTFIKISFSINCHRILKQVLISYRWKYNFLLTTGFQSDENVTSSQFQKDSKRSVSSLLIERNYARYVTLRFISSNSRQANKLYLWCFVPFFNLIQFADLPTRSLPEIFWEIACVNLWECVMKFELFFKTMLKYSQKIVQA